LVCKLPQQNIFIEKEKSLKIIKSHPDVVAGKMRGFNDNPRVLEKYKWVAGYHNDLVGMLKFKNECAVIEDLEG
jgi:hypothetical protein